MRPRAPQAPRPSYFDRLATRHPEVAEGEAPAAPPRRLPSPLRRHRALATAVATTLSLAGIAGATVLAVRLAEGPLAIAAPAAEETAGSTASAAAVEPVWVPVRIEVVDDPGAVPPASSDEDVDAPVSLDTDLPDLPPARSTGRSATATALAGVGTGRGYERPVKVFAPAPEYPPAPARDGRGGIVLLAVRVDESGAVEAVDVRRSVDPALDAAAVDAVRRWLFIPARLEGRAVPATIQTAVNFVPPAPAPAATTELAESRPADLEAAPTPPPTSTAPEAAPPVSAAAITEKRPAGETRPATRLVTPLPAYPAGAWASGRAGDVTLDVDIATDGRVADVRLVAGLGASIDAAAMTAVRRWRFSPALQDGVAVPSTQRYSLRFAPQVAALEPPRP